MAFSYKSNFFHVIYVITIFNLFTIGLSQKSCPPGSLVLTQSKTGDLVNNKPQFLVEVFNQCGSCAQADVKLFCDSFQTVGNFPGELTKNGNDCVLFAPVNPVQEIQFTYASDTQFPFRIVSYKQGSCL